jgi:hypothetical protein
MDAGTLFGDLADRLAETGVMGARGVEQLGLPTLGLDVEGTVVHLVVDDGRLVVREGAVDDGLVVELEPRRALSFSKTSRRPSGSSWPGAPGPPPPVAGATLGLATAPPLAPLSINASDRTHTV